LPKNAGGLGVLNLREQNKALMIKNLYKFYNSRDLPWVDLLWKAYYSNGNLPSSNNPRGSFWWKSCVSMQDDFKKLVTIKVGSGASILLWHEKWTEEILSSKLSHLYSFAKNKRISLQKAIEESRGDLYDLFNLPLSMIAVDRINMLQHLLQSYGQGNNHSLDE
jgi:hypothetical protein